MKRSTILALLVSCWFAPTSTQAYSVLTTSDGEEVRWYQPVVYYYINPAGFEDFDIDSMVQVTIQSFETWMDTQLGPTFVYAGTTDVKKPSDDCLNVIFFVQDPMEWMEMFHLEDGKAMAMTRTYVASGGAIVGFDLGFNDAGYTFTNTDDPTRIRTDYANTLTHEIGHVLGLDHSEDPEAVMYPTAPEGETSKRTLAEDDREGIRYLYRDAMPDAYGCNAPPDPRCADSSMSCHQAAPLTSSHPGHAPSFLWTLPVVWIRLRRNKTSRGRKPWCANAGG